MKFSIKRELPLLGLVLLPFLYLFFIWNDLPQRVPLHWNYKGEIDRFGDKSELFLVPVLLPLLTYIIFLLIPLIDPKKQLQKMGNKYYQLRLIMVLSMALISFFILYSTKHPEITSTNLLLIGIGVMILLLGNYFKTIQPNYFIGIRTPWALENKEIWKSTHKLAGKICVVGGLLLILAGLVLPGEWKAYALMTIITILVLVPIIHSYLEFRKLGNTAS